MTFLEKAKEICKEKGETFDEKEIIKKCPEECGLENESECMRIGECACIECWNREMPLKCPNSTRMMNREMPNTEAKDELKERLELIDELKQVEYNKGLNDGRNEVWELAKIIIGILDKENHQLIPAKELIKIYGSNDLLDIFAFTPQEALAKLKAYEEAQSKVVVGDVVNHREYGNGIVTIEDGDFYHVVCANGEVVCFEKNRVTKTGKHIDIKSILESIGE